MSFLFFYPRMRPLDDNGDPMPGCYLKFFESETTTPTPVYADGDLETELGSTVTSNAAGIFPAIYGDPSVVYRMQLYDADDTLISDDDPIHPHVAFPAGTIVMFDGDATSRDAAYPPALWELCDGDNGTKDTRDRVPIGVSNTKPISGDGSTSDGSGGTTDPAGGHDHGGATDGHALTEAENGPHTHEGATVACSADDNAQLQSDHWVEISGEQSLGTQSLPTFETASSGDGDPHTHDITAETDHTHDFDATPPYFTVWFLKRKS